MNIICKFVATVALVTMATSATADEGMWTFDNLPTQILKDRHGFDANAEWVNHVMKSSVRLSAGGSGSFVSKSGIILTNHHVAADTIYKLSSAERNLMRDGFVAHQLSEELKAPDLEVDQLQSITDVTDRVNAAVTPEMSAEEAVKARRAVIANIENEAHTASGLKSEVVTLYQGGQYSLYQYKTYSDVRLVFCPEESIAFFGGDPDNFEFPRFDLDMTILRAYENGQPAQITNFLKWNVKGVSDNDLVFVSGNPGRTSRLFTVAALEFQRDLRAPFSLKSLQRYENYLKLYSDRGGEQARIARDELFGAQNSRKVYQGRTQGLYSQSFFQQKQKDEVQLRAQVAANPELAALANAWDEVATAQKSHKSVFKDRYYFDQGRAFNSTLFVIARHIVRMSDEDAKPNAERLSEYRDSGRESLMGEVLSTAPIYKDFEQYKLGVSLTLLVEEYGLHNKMVQSILKGRDPSTRAAEIISGTSLFEVDSRRFLTTGEARSRQALVKKSYDPMIELVRVVDAHARKIRKKYDVQVVEVERQAYAKIAKSIFALRGKTTYPDATFSPRLAFGVVRGYTKGTTVYPSWTTLGGTFEHESNHSAQEPWKLPASWTNARGQMDLSVPFNFVSTADIIGGNSGSPVISREGELVGLIFDGNIDSLTADYAYSEVTSRSISVHSAGMTEALKSVYGATELVTELLQ
jgi:hypothetical protein